MESTTKKKLFIAIVVANVIIFTAFLIINYWWLPRQAIKMANVEEQTKIEGLVASESISIVREINEAVTQTKFIPAEQAFYYQSLDTNDLYQFDLIDGKRTSLLPFQELTDILDVRWSLDGRAAVVYDGKGEEETTESEQQKAIFSRLAPHNKILLDFNTRESLILSEKYVDITWLDNNKIAYHYFDEDLETNYISRANANGSDWENLVTLDSASELAEVEFVGYADNNLYYFYEDNEARALYRYDFSEQKVKQVISGITAVLISPTGQKLLCETYGDDSQPQLFIIDNNGDNRQDINLGNAYIEQALWGSEDKSIYYTYGELVDLEESEGNLNYMTLESIWRLDLASGDDEQLVSVVAENPDIGVKEMFLSADETKLYFINFLDLNLYSVDLVAWE
ncbi:MAG: hypothetical protein HQ530_03075 [Parcubacteria group bacterium]|nr:hypothetical protein [Parcubacteria group bacterium]